MEQNAKPSKMQKYLRLIAKIHLTPAQSIVAGFALMILIGAVLLALPFASRSGESVGFLDALFTATSANCVTGLVVLNTMESWTVFGKIVILILIQFGGLGYMTVITVGMLALHRRITLKDRLVIQASFNQEGPGGMVRLVRRVLLITFVAEFAGMILLTAAFLVSTDMRLWEALWQGFFHSVSAFCNAGFDNIGRESLTPFVGNPLINFTVMGLIVVGGIGFPVCRELYGLVRNRAGHALRRRVNRLSLHTKITLAVTASLILSGFVLFLLLEWNNPETLGPLGFFEKIQAALFQSVTLRTAGFNTISQSGLCDFSQVLSCVLMLIGGSSAGRAGGVKTATFGVLIIAMLSAFRGKNGMEAYGRRLPLDLLQKALTVVCSVLAVVFAATLALYFTEGGSAGPHTFIDLLFETCSAMGTVGVTTGVTPHLSAAGKLIIAACMFLGRIGPVTLVLALARRQRGAADAFTYPEERVLIG